MDAAPAFDHSSDSNDEEEFGLFQALPVADVAVDESAWEFLPQSVEEYLARVRQEAKRIPNVVTSHIDPRNYDGERTAAVPLEAQSAALKVPQTAFTKALLEFLGVRLKLQQALLEQGRQKLGASLPPRQDSGAWKAFCLRQGGGISSDNLRAPSRALLLLTIDQGAVNRLLRWQVSWISEEPGLMLQCSQWLFGLMAVLEKPVHKETCAQLRLLLRLCSQQQSEGAEVAAVSQVLAVIAGAFFRQDESLILQGAQYLE
ncbi:hypothetical protein WJX74_008551 [Apatococcus lobatus]|uniref:Gem-associated protein 2 n=1 Tax=Apatococcus lobatus TaxID=904363 RepID=A0AAW1SHH7_9CHLO